jgi:aminoglycoside phosphotransferase family enzyme/predicted kinase
MCTQNQDEVVRFLESSSTHAGAAVERIETHGSVVFLAGARAWKLKRAVRYDYMDFSTLDRRKAMCEAEVRINRRAAPAIYRGVVPVTRERDGELALGGAGVPVEWLVEMVRFDQDTLLDRLAARRRLDLRLMRPLASAVAAFHRDAPRRHDHGGAHGMAWVIDGNAAAFREQGAGILNQAACEALTRDARQALACHRAQLDARRDAGFVRQCHGDLHLRNIVMLDGRPTLFDAIEFNDEIACIDVLYDLAFLLMDLWRRQLPQHANALWNAYLDRTGDLDGISLVPLFLSCRAAVRAKTSATAANLQQDPQRRRELESAAREYLSLAQRLLHPAAPCVVAVGGLSGSGKTTLAYRLAHGIGAAPGAVVIRSDEIRKRLCGVEPLQRLGPEGYTDDVTRRVYETVADRAVAIARSGHAAIADAVFARATDRDAIERAAQTAHVPFFGIWLDAPAEQLIARITRRVGDASDADANVVRRQLAENAGTIRWRRIDASSGPEQVARHASASLDEYPFQQTVSDGASVGH